MSRMVRWLAVGVAGLLSLAVLAWSALYVGSELRLRQRYEQPLYPLVLPTDASAIAEGKRLARIRGCFDGCHGRGISGGVFWDEPWQARLVAPDLTRVAQSHSDAALERVIRHGIRQSGISTQGMPSPMFYHLSDADLAAILAFIRSEPVGDGPATEIQLGPLGRWQLLFGEWLPYAEEIDHQAVRLDPGGPAQPLVWGRYLAETVCTECHGADLAGGGDTPNLVVAAAYSLADFRRLLRTGVPLGERQLGLMAKVAVKRFAHFTDPEIAALHGFLRQRAGLPAEP